MAKKYLMLVVIAAALVLFSLLFQGTAIKVKASFPEKEDQSFEKEEEVWRSERDKEMRSPLSWLTIAGLYWLEEGESSFGSGPSNRIILPSHSSPPSAGKFIFKKGKIKVVANKGAGLKVAGKEIKKIFLKGDDAGRSDVVELGELRMWVIKRGERYAIRLRDLNAPAYKNYKGLDFFPPSKKFKIEADFIPYPDSKTVTVKTIINTEYDMTSPGYVRFMIDGKEYRLDAFRGDAKGKKLFFIFRDETNGKETYEPGRFMVSDILDNGKVDLNFNRAYNPPCAYTPYATCPLASPQNWLKVRIEAGEKKYPGSHHWEEEKKFF